ncbi:hypothetical protein DL96DRAFT_1814105 [Flagelloscypha sp. PMI_526]|nr:hypothetical protein DL96DRAFT_1814105 [Flagelloscypha sp. PMI_526]
MYSADLVGSAFDQKLLSTPMTTRELPPELWIQIYGVLATLSDSHREMVAYFLICKLSYNSLYPRLFETLHVSLNHNPSFKQWFQTHQQILTSAVKRTHIPWSSNLVDSDFIVSIFETCRHVERVACWVGEESFENLAIARALASLPKLSFLHIYVQQLSFLFEKREELSTSFLHIEKLSLHFWNEHGTQKMLQALKSIDFSLFKFLARLSLNTYTQGSTQEILSALLTLDLPSSLNVIVIFEDGNDWETIPSTIDDPRIVYYKQSLFEESAILAASISVRERPYYGAGEYPFDDWAEVTSSRDQCLWLWAEEAIQEGKKVFSRPQ